MATQVRIVCGAAGAGKTARLWGRWLAALRAAPGAALWLTPTRRRADALRRRLLADTGGACGARVDTAAELADAVVRANDPAARPLGEVQRRLLLDDLLAALRPGGRLEHFERVLETRGFADGLAALVRELRGAGIPAGRFAAEVGGVAGPKLGPCATLAAAYENELRARNADDAEGRVARASDLLRRGLRRPFASVRAVFADDFNDFTPLQLEFLEALAAGADELWLALADEPGDERAELFSRPRATRLRLERLSPEVEWAGDGDIAESPSPSDAPSGPLPPAGEGWGGGDPHPRGPLPHPGPTPRRGEGAKPGRGGQAARSSLTSPRRTRPLLPCPPACGTCVGSCSGRRGGSRRPATRPASPSSKRRACWARCGWSPAASRNSCSAGRNPTTCY